MRKERTHLSPRATRPAGFEGIFRIDVVLKDKRRELGISVRDVAIDVRLCAFMRAFEF